MRNAPRRSRPRRIAGTPPSLRTNTGSGAAEPSPEPRPRGQRRFDAHIVVVAPRTVTSTSSPGPTQLSPGARRWVAVIFVSGMVYRLGLVPQIRFTGDESQFWATALRIARGETFPSFGPAIMSSSARHPGPAFYDLLALPQVAGPSPYWGSAFVVLLHLLAGLAVVAIAGRAAADRAASRRTAPGLATHEATGDRAAILAAALFVGSPWDILYGSSIWLSSVAPAWATFLLFSASRVKDRTWAQGGLVFFLLTSPQFHMSSPIAWVVAAALVLARPPPRWSGPALAIGLTLAAVTYAPAIASELSTGFANTQAILTRGLGQEPWDRLAWSPVKVFGYAILMSTAEIGYHFARGYWTGGLRESEYYFSSDGVASWWRLHGSWGVLILASVLASLAAWADGVLQLVRKPRCLFPARWRQLGEREQWMLALLLGLAGATALLLVSKKGFFPHYINVLTPVLILPVAWALDRGLPRSPRGHVAAGVITTILVVAMVGSAVRYVRSVDRLNGLGSLISVARRIAREPQPVRVRFRGFGNGHALGLLVHHQFEKPGWIRGDASISYTIHNHRVHDGSVPAGGEVHGGVLVVRQPPPGAPPASD